MANKYTWSGITIAVQSALASAITVGAGGVTKASPGVMTYTGTDPSNGDALYLSSVLGMSQLDERVIRAANVDSGANTLELEGEDTTLYDTMVSANAQVITFGTSLSIVSAIQASGGSFEKIDATLLHETVRSFVLGPASEFSLILDCIWDPADPGLAAMKTSSKSKAKRAIRISHPAGPKIYTVGYVGATGMPTGSAQGLMLTSIEISGQGVPTSYST